MEFPKIHELCSRKDAFACGPDRDRLFAEAMAENLAWQMERQPFVRMMAERAGVKPERIRTLDDVDSIPPLFVGTMKIHGFRSIDEQDVAMVLTSSGTSGQKTQSFFDSGSLDRLSRLAICAFDGMGMRRTDPVRYFVLGYERSHASEVGTSWSDDQLLSLAPTAELHWTITWDDAEGRYRFDANRWARALVAAGDAVPVRMIGFPAFMYQLVEEIKRDHGRIRVHPDSFIIAGGGWKNHLGTPMTHREFSQYIEDTIGLPAANVRDVYGMVEHGVPYTSCPRGVHHAPIYSRIVTRDPLTLRRLDHGQPGQLHLFTPYNTAQPNLSLLSTDIAVIGRDCACGVPGDFIQSVRRGGVKLHKGCAIAAQEILDQARRRQEART